LPDSRQSDKLEIHHLAQKGREPIMNRVQEGRKPARFAFAALAALAMAAGLASRAPADSLEALDRQALDRLEWMPPHQRGMMNVDANEGAFLRDQVIEVNAKRILEIGTSNGYSAIWLAMGARRTGGHVTTLEIDDTRAQLARENFRVAGVEPQVTLVHGDALKEIPKLEGPFEVVFIDAWKADYVKYLEMTLPMVPPGGVILAHNTRNLRDALTEFIEKVRTHPQLETRFVEAGPGGFSVSVKRP
jgi:predicted O-methyltransferase YrrM